MAFTEVTDGLLFPEGPIAMPDGTVIVTEMFGAGLTRVHPDGRKETVAEVAGRLQWAASVPAASCSSATTAPASPHREMDGLCFPRPDRHRARTSGADQQGRRETGEVYGSLHGVRRPRARGTERPRVRRPRWLLLHRPRDDAQTGREAALTGIYYAKADGS